MVIDRPRGQGRPRLSFSIDATQRPALAILGGVFLFHRALSPRAPIRDHRGMTARPAIFLALLLVPAGHAAAQAPPPIAGPTARVERVVDGDTVILLLDGRQVRVRLIGVDAPESVDPRRPVERFGREASAFLGQHPRHGRPVPVECRGRGHGDKADRDRLFLAPIVSTTRGARVPCMLPYWFDRHCRTGSWSHDGTATLADERANARC
jgi:hypothetical protein